MRLERHVGGLGRARSVNYLTARGWQLVDGQWVGPELEAEPCTLGRALHHQITRDLTSALGCRIVDYSPRGYVRVEDPLDGTACTLPAALRRQARREGRPVRELTYSLFLSKLDSPT